MNWSYASAKSGGIAICGWSAACRAKLSRISWAVGAVQSLRQLWRIPSPYRLVYTDSVAGLCAGLADTARSQRGSGRTSVLRTEQ